jgi:ketosteroid isomerase-like protein
MASRKMVIKKGGVLLCLVLASVLLMSCGQPQEQDPASVVQAFYEAASAEDLETFMALVADDAEIEWGRVGLVTGHEQIRREAEALFRDWDFTFILSELEVDGQRVTFNHKMVLNGTQDVIEECVNEVMVEGGKIKSALLVSCEYP